MYNCPECKEPFEKGTKYCSKCGCNLEEQFIINPVCPKCKKEFSDGTRFCDFDGTILVSFEKLIPKCEICNKVYNDGTKYCPNDGGRVIAEAYRKQIIKIEQTQNLNLNSEEIEKQFNLFQWLYWGGIITSVIVVGIFGLIAAMVFYYILLYKAWSIIPKEKTDITPEKAVGFLFIPFYNFYWNFISIKGLGEKLIEVGNDNKLQIHTIRGAEVIPILAIVSLIPYLNIATGIALIIFQFLFIKDVKNAMISIIESERE